MTWSGETGSVNANQEQNPNSVRYKDNPPENDHISPPQGMFELMIFRQNPFRLDMFSPSLEGVLLVQKV